LFWANENAGVIRPWWIAATKAKERGSPTKTFGDDSTNGTPLDSVQKHHGMTPWRPCISVITRIIALARRPPRAD